MITVYLVLLIASAAPAVQNPTISNQKVDQDDVVRVDTNLVTVPVVVLDREGRYVATLRKEDFRISEDEIEQSIASFAPVEQPFTILFLLDVSGSIFRLVDVARAANAFASQLRPDDQLMAISFSDTTWVNVLLQPTKISDLHRQIRLRSGNNRGDTLIYDAVDDALKRMNKIRGRKAIVLFSNGRGNGLFATTKSTLRKAEEQDALIYTVQFDTLVPVVLPSFVNREEVVKRFEKAKNYMSNLAQKTGGRYFEIETLPDLKTAFGQVAEELRRQYTLGYYPKTKLEAGQRRQITVRVRLPNLVVRARDSYIVDKDRVKTK
jgi:Ca-activated chloride channel homolog